MLINPNSGVNTDLPNMQLAYTATLTKSFVIDLNTKQRPRNRYLNNKDKKVLISIRSAALNEANVIKDSYLAKHPDSTVKSITGIVDIQCCYPFLKWKLNEHFKEEFCDELPFPDYSLFDSFSIFKKNWGKGKWAYPILTSLGCPFKCVYCAARSRVYKVRSPKNCVDEIKQAVNKYNIKSFQVIDDCFNVINNRVLEFCRLIKPLKLKWYCTNGLRADLFNEAQAKAISGSGCKQISFGVESLDKKVLINIHKGLTREKVEQAVRIAKKYFDDINCYFIIGLPGSSYKSDLDNVEWVKQMGVNGHFSYFIPSNEEARADATFYGKKAKPRSKAYPFKEQEEIYNMTQAMRPYTISYLVRRLLKKFFNRL